MCAAIAALDAGASVLMVEKADLALAGGNSKYTAGAMRFAYDSGDDLMALLSDPSDDRLAVTDFGSYTTDQFSIDLEGFNEGAGLTREQRILVDESLPTMQWLASHGIRFDPIYSRQTFEKDGRKVFWGGLTLEAEGEGEGLVAAELDVFSRMGGKIRYESAVTDLITDTDSAAVVGVVVNGSEELRCGSVVLGCGGFEASEEMRVEHLGPDWAHAKVRGTPHNTGIGLELAYKQGAVAHGVYRNCHATPMDLHMADYGNLDIPAIERKNYRKICYFLGVMVNADGNRFVDEGKDFRNYTYAQFGRAVLEQPGHFAWQLFDHKVFDLLYGEYTFEDASFVESDTIDGLIGQLSGVDQQGVRHTIGEFNAAVDDSITFDPTIKDGKSARGLNPPRTNWAQRLDTPPFRAYPVTGGITFTYGGLKVDDKGAVLRADGSTVNGLHACGELVGGVFVAGYPGGSGLTSGAVFGRRAGRGAAGV